MGDGPWPEGFTGYWYPPQICEDGAVGSDSCVHRAPLAGGRELAWGRQWVTAGVARVMTGVDTWHTLADRALILSHRKVSSVSNS